MDASGICISDRFLESLGMITVLEGDSRELLKDIPDNSIDSCVCDPPYALTSIVSRYGADNAAPTTAGPYARGAAGFMGKRWDTGETAFDPAFWREVWRVLKPGAHVAAFSGTRTCHRLAVAIEDAGFEIRDRLTELVAADTHVEAFLATLSDEQRRAFLKAMEESQFGGQLAWVFGTGFPKSHDVAKGIDKANGHARPVVSQGAAVKRMIPGADQHKQGWEKANGREYVPTITSAASAAWAGWGTALKPALEPIVLARKPIEGTVASNVLKWGCGALNIDGCRIDGVGNTGRWPANVLHDGSGEVVEAFPADAGAFAAVKGTEPSLVSSREIYGLRDRVGSHHHGDSGSASRFFYSAKAGAEDRHGAAHPTVKPVNLMAWLCRLVTPAGGLVLDCFAGTGTTGQAADREGFDCILMERDPESVADIKRRLAWIRGEGRLTAQERQRPTKAAPPPMPLFGDDP